MLCSVLLRLLQVFFYLFVWRRLLEARPARLQVAVRHDMVTVFLMLHYQGSVFCKIGLEQLAPLIVAEIMQHHSSFGLGGTSGPREAARIVTRPQLSGFPSINRGWLFARGKHWQAALCSPLFFSRLTRDKRAGARPH